jgi:transposase
MAGKKNSSNSEEFRRRLSELQTLYGSQQAAANKLGVSVSTFKNYKSGKTTPRDKGIATKVNRLRGANSKKINSEEFETRHQLRTEKEDRAKEKRDISRSTKVKLEATATWVQDQLDGLIPAIKSKIRSLSEYVAYEGNDSFNVQFWDGFSGFGKPASLAQSKVKAWGLYSSSYNPNAPLELIGSTFPITSGVGKVWNIRQTNEYLSDKLADAQTTTSRRKFNLIAYIGYQLLN